MPARQFLIALLLSACAMPVLGAPPAVAPDPAGVLSHAFVDAVNTDDAAKRRGSVTALFAASTLQSVGMEKLVAQAASIRERFGTLTLHHGEIVKGRNRAVLHLFAHGAGSNQWHDFQFYVDDALPDGPRVTQLVFVGQVAEPIALPNGAITSPETLAWLSGWIERLVRDDGFSGSILIASGDKVIFDRTVGVSDVAGKKKNDSSTRFDMASGGKMFTAVAVAKLVEAGKLDWKTPLLDAVDGFPDSPRARAVTIHHLLTHTSGIGEYWTDDYEKARSRISTNREMLPWVLRAGFDADPGSTVAYSNSNFVLAGLAVEKATGMSLDAYLAKTIFKPLGMKSTGYPLTGDPGLAAPIIRKDGAWAGAKQGLRGSAAGGSYSTTHDMLLFIRALVAGKIVRPETVKLLTTSKTSGFKNGFEYGYGFEVIHYEQAQSFGHGGITDGVDFDLEYFPGKDLTLILFGNRGAPAFDSLRRNTRRLITGER